MVDHLTQVVGPLDPRKDMAAQHDCSRVQFASYTKLHGLLTFCGRWILRERQIMLPGVVLGDVQHPLQELELQTYIIQHPTYFLQRGQILWVNPTTWFLALAEPGSGVNPR